MRTRNWLRLACLLPFALWAPGCGNKQSASCDSNTPCPAGQTCQQNQCMPALTGGDLAAAAPDLGVPAPDLATAVKPGYKYATSKLALPMKTFKDPTPFAIDIDGDGKPDNQFASLIYTVSSYFMVQDAVDQAVSSGQAVGLIGVTAKALDDDAMTAVQVLTAKPTAAPPKFDGSDTFAPQVGLPTAQLSGTIQTGALDTRHPSMLGPTEAQQFTIQIPLGLGSGALQFTLYGVHVQGQINADGIMQGQVHGVVRKTDIDNQIVPALATAITEQINMDPGSSLATTLISLFENPTNPVTKDKCTNHPDECCAKNPKTCKILPGEVSSNFLVMGLLKPDVHVFNGDKWQPDAKAADKDAMSVGIGFTAVKAKF